MLNARGVRDLIDQINGFETLEALQTQLTDLFSHFDFEGWAYTIKMPDSFHDEEVVCLHNWTPEFVERYKTIHLYNCPRFKHLWNSPAPLIYDESFVAQDMRLLPDQPEPVRKVIDDILEFNYYGFGFSLTLHGRFGDKGVLTIQNRHLRPEGLAAIDRFLPVAQTVFPFIHTRYIDLSGWTPPGGKARLSDRELECLRWAADGKTAWETAAILHLAERTVVFHLNNAAKKLQAANRVQAVAKAILYQLL